MPYAVLDQHVATFDPAQSLFQNFQNVNPSTDDHTAHAVLARFGFRGEKDAIVTGNLTGGGRLRTWLACALGSPPIPVFLILDEPTNHLDLEEIAVLETAMDAYDGAILVVSHDEQFLKRLSPGRRSNCNEASA